VWCLVMFDVVRCGLLHLVRFRMVSGSLVWFGVVWFGFGVVWYGVVSCGLV
jgi:hypothetical protein